MKRYKTSRGSKFSRYGIIGHSVSPVNHYRGGVRL